MLIYMCDGGSRGNPGPAFIGVVFWKRIPRTSSAKKITPDGKISTTIGTATNNEAEWQAIIVAVRHAKENAAPDEDIFMYSDSLLAVNQANGIYKIKEARLKQFYKTYMQVRVGMKITLSWLPRQLTYLADKLT